VLDVACGSSREVFELAPDIAASRAIFTLVDYDPDALAFSRDRLNYAGIPPEQLLYRRYNAFKMTNHGRTVAEFGMQDVIYSVGFFDYVKDEVLVPMLSSLYRLLTPGGALITSFKDSARYEREEYHWFVDWDGFYQRTEEESYSTLIEAGIPAASISSVRDASGVIIFFTATR
jgi:SAM-dependent methyltransferase